MIQRAVSSGQRAGRRGNRRRWTPAPLLAALCALLAGCGYYSFTGASIPEHLDTVAVPLVEDQSLGGVPAMDQALTDLLVERFVRQTRLVLEPDEGQADAVLAARIESYRTEPVAVTGDEVAALNRVTIRVAVRYLDRVEDAVRLERTFSGSAEYAAADLELEEAAVAEALREIADDVFTAATSDW